MSSYNYKPVQFTLHNVLYYALVEYQNEEVKSLRICNLYKVLPKGKRRKISFDKQKTQLQLDIYRQVELQVFAVENAMGV